jgi:type I restriction enzyme S subunit
MMFPTKRLGEIADFKNGLNFQQSQEGVNIKFLGVGDFQDRTVIVDMSLLGSITLDFIPKEEALLKDGDLVFVRSNGSKELVGRCVMVYPRQTPLAYTGFAIRARINDTKTVSPFFVLQHIQNGLLKQSVKREGSGTNISNLNQDILAGLEIPLPPLPEQNAIADTLSTWDAAIEKTERLIAAKEKLFRRDRIEEIHHPEDGRASWSPLGRIFQAMTRKNSVGETNVLTTSAQRGLVSQRKYFTKSVASENLENYFLLEKGQFAYNRSSSNGYPYGAVKRLEDSDRGVLSTLNICMALIDPAAHNSDYFVHALESGVLNRGLGQICQEGARSHGLLNVSREDFFSLEVPAPTKPIQDAIAKRLNLASLEIDLMKRRLKLLQTQKRGLMQKLLTGTWRVKYLGATNG